MMMMINERITITYEIILITNFIIITNFLLINVVEKTAQLLVIRTTRVYCVTSMSVCG